VTARPLLRYSIAGLVILGVLLQVCLMALQLALLTAPAKSEAPVFSVICTAHGAVALEAADAPDSPRTGCAFCPLCGHSGVAPIATPPVAISIVVFAVAQTWMPAIADEARSSLTQGLPPPGRGPPV